MKEPKHFGVAVIGLGAIGTRHTQLYHSSSNANLIAISDANNELSQKISEDLDIELTFKNYEDLLKETNIHAISICVPNHLHADFSVKALESGKHVLCEKPMATNFSDAQRMLDAAKANNRQLMIGFFERFRPSTQSVKKMIINGAFGEVYHAQIVYQRRRGIPGLGSWFTNKKKSGGGPLIDIGVHILDLALYLMDYPSIKTVSAATHQKFGDKSDYNYINMWAEKSSIPGGTFDVEDYATTLIRLTNGSTISMECSWAANLEQRQYACLLGEKRGVKLENGDAIIYGEDHGTIATSEIQTKPQDPYQNEIEHFIECAKKNILPIASGTQIINLQRLIDAIYKSALIGHEIDFEETE